MQALRDKGFSLKAAPHGGIRAVRGRCEVHIRMEGRAFDLRIPVVHLGPDRPFTDTLSKYLDDRNAAGKGPGTYALAEDTIWYSATSESGPEAAARTAQAMQEAVEKTGPKILNMLR